MLGSGSNILEISQIRFNTQCNISHQREGGEVTFSNLWPIFGLWSEVALSHRHREAVENPAGEEDCHDHRAADQGVPLEEEYTLMF